jgi:hypothetical protein
MVAGGAGHPAVALLLGLAAAGLAGAVVAMAWSVHVRQIRLAERLARRQFLVTADPGGDVQSPAKANGKPAGGRPAPAVTIEGPDSVVAGEQARYRVRSPGGVQVVSWAVGGGAVSHAPDPGHPDDLLVIPDQPGDLTIIVRAREGMLERRATKSVTAVPDVTSPAPPFTLRLFLHGWGLAAVAVLIVGFAAALDALGTLPAADFIALVVPLAALLGVVAVGWGTADAPRRTGQGRAQAGPADPAYLPAARPAEPLAPARPRTGDRPD